MFTQKRALATSGSCRLAARLMQARSEGGSQDTEVTAVAVMPWRRLSWVAEITVTALASRRIALRKSASKRSPMTASPLNKRQPVVLIVATILVNTTVV